MSRKPIFPSANNPRRTAVHMLLALLIPNCTERQRDSAQEVPRLTAVLAQPTTPAGPASPSIDVLIGSAIPNSTRQILSSALPSPEQQADIVAAGLLKRLENSRPEIIVEGIISGSEAQVVPTGDPNNQRTIVTRYVMTVKTAWGGDPGPEAEFWVKGGILPFDSPEEAAGYPYKGERDSYEIYPNPGDQVIVALKTRELVPGLMVRRQVFAIPVSEPVKAADRNPPIDAGVQPTALSIAATARSTFDSRFDSKTSH